MLTPTPIPFRKRRSQKLRPWNPPPPPPPAALAVVEVIDLNYGGDVLSFTVVFNTTAAQPLVDPIGAEPSKWTARYSGALFEASSLLLVQYDRIEVGMEVMSGQAGANVLNYSNAPSDIGDTLGRMLSAFGDYPL